MDWIEQLEPVGLIAFAMLLGGTVGLERELAGKAAGLRTLMLVAGAAALFVSVGDLIASYARRVLTQPVADFHGELIRADPIRIIEAIVTGTSILGAGTIWRSATAADAVGGLTTAASACSSRVSGSPWRSSSSSWRRARPCSRC